MSALGSEIESFRVQSRLEMEKEGERLPWRGVFARAQIRKLEQHAVHRGNRIRRQSLLAASCAVYAADLALKLAEGRIRTRLTTPGPESALVNNFVARS